MTLTGLIVLLVIAGVCGSLGAGIAGYSHLGCLSSVVVGFLGAWIGAWIARQMHFPPLWIIHVQGESFPVVWSIIGAAIFGGVASFLTSRSPQGF